MICLAGNAIQPCKACRACGGQDLLPVQLNIISAYKETYVDLGIMPTIYDPSSKNSLNNLLSGYKFEDFKAFIDKLVEHSNLLNDKGATNDSWRIILGEEFPKEEETKSACNEIICAFASHRQKIPWSLSRGSAVIVALRAEDVAGHLVPYESNGTPLDKGITLHFKALTSAKRPYTVMWQITNTGEEATKANCLRGDFYPSDEGTNGRRESTSYTGNHSVQCFVIKNRVCIAKSRDFIVNIR